MKDQSTRGDLLARYNAIVDHDGTIVTTDGKILMFSIERFVRDIVEGDCCFICGDGRQAKEFNDEHILPRWLLERQSLFSRQISLPNLTGYKYGSYVIPCCKDCNTLMGNQFENPIRQLFEKGHESIAEYVSSNGTKLIYNWLALIFIKTHLKDKFLRTTRDTRKGDDSMIADRYDFSVLHHAHCVARSFYTQATWIPPFIGSLCILHAEESDHFENFDFVDLYHSQSMLIRIGDTALVAVMDDACAALSKFRNEFMKIRGSLSPLQLREILVHLSYINLQIKERPKFCSSFVDGHGYSITMSHPNNVELLEYNQSLFGEILSGLCSELLGKHPNRDQIVKHMQAGEWGFLFYEKGEFQESPKEADGDVDN